MGNLKELQHLSLATTYEIDEDFDSDKFIKMRLRVCHDGVNPNRSNFVVSDMESARDSIKNIPILAHVIFDEDDQPQFGGHDMVLEPHKMRDGEYKLIYKEVPIGVVPETCNHTIEEYDGKNYVYCDAYIWREYSNYAEDIIERDKEIKLSMEIIVDAYSYNAKENVYNITDYRYQGITFLNKDFGTGMKNALATTETFDDHREKFVLMMQELKSVLADSTDKGGSIVDEKVKALLEQYGLSFEDLSFSIEDLSIEEIEQKLKDEYDTNNDDDDDTNDDNEPKKFVKSFELSHEDIRRALYQLLEIVEEEDNEWYYIDRVYDNYFEYQGMVNGKIYRQNYIKDDENVAFEGERVELFQERLTKEEKDALDEMRSNYSALKQENEQLKQFQATKLAEERKQAEDELFAQFDEQLAGNEEYEQLKQKASEYELGQLEKEVAFILVKNSTSFKFTAKQPTKKDKVKIELSKSQDDEVGEFDDLFQKYNINKEEN